ncbi:MAG: non-canonical purine NTP pyrophosphatase [Deltaproteobacteria bacterium]|nr:non-canonical purine NTP pyrophosphatase [Deltaproteobacteria bacterium]
MSFRTALSLEQDPIVVATTNNHKYLELNAVARRFGVKLISLDAACKIKNLGPMPEIIESGSSYMENAFLKAVAALNFTGMAAIGDDSGLEVEALGGRPGLRSARYLGVNATYTERMTALVDELKLVEVETGNKNRTAHYVCALVLLFPDGKKFEVQSSLKGCILDKPLGNGGFGYDPIVWIDSLNATLAQVEFEVTCEKGFRAMAAERLFAKVTNECI